jgi:hypothetical protein
MMRIVLFVMPAREGLAMKRALVVLALLTLASCVRDPTAWEAPRAWTRRDGVAIVPDKLQADMLACKDEVEHRGLSDQGETIFNGCMGEKGYLRQHQ